MKINRPRSALQCVAALTFAVITGGVQAQPALGVLPKTDQGQYAQPTLNASQPTPSQPQIIPTAPAVAAKAFILMDADSGAVLAESGADDRLAPASLTKLMTSYVLSYEIEQGHVHPEDMVSIRIWVEKHRVLSFSSRPLAPVDDVLAMFGTEYAPGNAAETR